MAAFAVIGRFAAIFGSGSASGALFEKEIHRLYLRQFGDIGIDAVHGGAFPAIAPSMFLSPVLGKKPCFRH